MASNEQEQNRELNPTLGDLEREKTKLEEQLANEQRQAAAALTEAERRNQLVEQTKIDILDLSKFCIDTCAVDMSSWLLWHGRLCSFSDHFLAAGSSNVGSSHFLQTSSWKRSGTDRIFPVQFRPESSGKESAGTDSDFNGSSRRNNRPGV
ncbi:unnamed protein product [Adineta ricciae]|uniref:Uncharacterized protein n=1 Tax=Adineta ricciae TaxID=249248 RepID=A0A816GWJ9_ADIRI|nr:unnamed protein product [Adineta ricciae]